MGDIALYPYHRGKETSYRKGGFPEGAGDVGARREAWMQARVRMRGCGMRVRPRGCEAQGASWARVRDLHWLTALKIQSYEGNRNPSIRRPGRVKV